MSLGYCGSCGEPVEGRFCRMCGVPYAAVPAEAVGATATRQLPYQTPRPAHRPTHAQPPESDFESLFRPVDGESNAYSPTQLIQPVEADYRMPPPAGPQGAEPFAAAPIQPFSAGPPPMTQPRPGDGFPPGPGSDEVGNWEDDGSRGVRKPVVWGAATAVIAVSAVILGLLYIGSHNGNGAPTGNNIAASTPSAVVSTTQQTIGAVNLAPGTVSPSPSASPSTSPSASASPTVAQGSTTLPLSSGSTGQYVRYVQTRLRQLGYYQGGVTGQYDQATAQAVTAFQARAQVTGDPSGTVGRSTVTALIAAGSQPNLRFGERSADVRRLQESLNAAENAGLNVSGKYDVATFAAVHDYQQQAGVIPTGTVNQQTWAALQAGRVV